MKKLQNEYLSLAIGTSISTFGNVNTPFVKAFLMGHIIGKSGRDITESEMEFINSIELIDYDLQSEGEDENEPIDNIEEVLVNHFDEVFASATSTKDIYRTLWDIYEDDYNADEDRDGQIFDDMVNDAIKYGITK
jgi:hypothetical protein